MSEYGEILPKDQYNKTLIDHVHPPTYENPAPADIYDLVVIGAGPAGLVTAAGAAGVGAKVALIERHLMGGDCLNVGCVPSKLMIRSARAAHDACPDHDLGVSLDGEVNVNFAQVMERLRRERAGISHHDSVKRFNELGIDVFFGSGSFIDKRHVEVDGKRLRFRRAVITTGARASYPPVDGLQDAAALTNETIFELTEQPERLAVIGAGPIGCELAQAFQRLGTRVHIFQRSPHVLTKEDADAAEVVQKSMIKDGVDLQLETQLITIKTDGAEKTIHFTRDGIEKQVTVDQILVAAGRAPNVEGLDLDAAGVNYDKHGIKINDNFRTSNSIIFAAGDVAMVHKFTHAADFAARAVIQNALFAGRKKLSSLVIPWATYTDPEIAHVGITKHEADKQGIAIDTFTQEFAEVDRAIADGETDGFAKIHVAKGTDKILGATIVARHAGEMIGEISLAMTAGIGLGKIASVIHPYPTQAEAIRKLGDQYNRTRLSPTAKKALGTWLNIWRKLNG